MLPRHTEIITRASCVLDAGCIQQTVCGRCVQQSRQEPLARLSQQGVDGLQQLLAPHLKRSALASCSGCTASSNAIAGSCWYARMHRGTGRLSAVMPATQQNSASCVQRIDWQCSPSWSASHVTGQSLWLIIMINQMVQAMNSVSTHRQLDRQLALR
jgi:hypothetical protein